MQYYHMQRALVCVALKYLPLSYCLIDTFGCCKEIEGEGDREDNIIFFVGLIPLGKACISLNLSTHDVNLT